MPNKGISAAASRHRNSADLDERTAKLCRRLGKTPKTLVVRQASPEELADLKARAAAKRQRPVEPDDDLAA